MRRLMMLAKQRPSIAMCAGLGHAERIPAVGVITYELREFNVTTNTDIGVIGRVAVDPAAPVVLPAPGKPVELPDTTAKGNLNATLRWGTPNGLRDLSPLHYGYDVYRVTKTRALANGWDATPPTTTALLAADVGTSKVNALAILPEKVLTNAEAANLAIDTVFVMDDNSRFKAGGTPFADGVEFYYFVVARDLLGHGGTHHRQARLCSSVIACRPMLHASCRCATKPITFWVCASSASALSGRTLDSKSASPSAATMSIAGALQRKSPPNRSTLILFRNGQIRT
jgi:hypothetical protein